MGRALAARTRARGRTSPPQIWGPGFFFAIVFFLKKAFCLSANTFVPLTWSVLQRAIDQATSSHETRDPKTEIRNPKPGIRNPKFETRNPKPEPRNPKPEHRTTNPKPQTPNPETPNSKPETRNPKSESRNPKPEILILTAEGNRRGEFVSHG